VAWRLRYLNTVIIPAETELMWTGTKHKGSKIPVCCHSLTLGVNPIGL